MPTAATTGLRAFRRDPLAALAAAAREGPLVRRRVGHLRVAVVTTPDAALELLVGNADRLRKGLGLERARLLLGDGLLTAHGGVHERHLEVVRPALRRGRVAGYAPVMGDAVAAAAGRLHDGARLDAAAEMARLALATAGGALFGTDLGPRAGEVGDALSRAMAFFDRPSLVVTDLAARLPLPAGIAFRRARRELLATVDALVGGRAGGPPGDDLLGMLLAARAQGRMDDAGVRDETLTLLIAGHETVANALAWTWGLLARHPQAEARLHQEVDALPGAPGAADLHGLPWTRAVLLEAMRLRPPAWLLGRRVVAPVRLCGTRLDPGTLVLVPVATIHRDARWVPDPDRFAPERFLPGGGAPVPGTAYMPFGAGPRRCVGQAFALQEAMLALAGIARGWRLEAFGPPPAPLPRVTMRPAGGMPMVARLRAPRRLRASRTQVQRPPR